MEFGKALPVNDDDVSNMGLCTPPFMSTERPVGGVAAAIFDAGDFGRSSDDVPNWSGDGLRKLAW